jgi:glyoxylase I family protein
MPDLTPLPLLGVHHIALICSNYAVSKAFYTEILGLQVLREVYRAERDSYKLDLMVNGQYVLELFSFPTPPPRPSRPEAQGLRHLAFSVADLTAAVQQLEAQHVVCEPIRVDEFTGRRFTFFADPDGLPLELYEV